MKLVDTVQAEIITSCASYGACTIRSEFSCFQVPGTRYAVQVPYFVRRYDVPVKRTTVPVPGTGTCPRGVWVAKEVPCVV